MRSTLCCAALALFAWACATSGSSSAPATVPPPSAATPAPRPGEVRLRDLKQLTFGGENAEAYFSFDGRFASLQRRGEAEVCDRIYTTQLFDHGEPLAQPAFKQISNGQGATTCSYFFPGGDELLYASTQLASSACPPRPDMSQGYVWAIYPGYDIFKAKADGSDLRRLTSTPGYDAEGTVCGKDGSIVFTSLRDGDLELYRMDKDGKNVKRLTFEPGYDGGAFFNADCTKIVWRASRPKPGPELDNYRALLAQGLVRPTQLELYVANADGSEPRQVTYLNAASFAPFWFPGRERIIFSSNYGDPAGREFELWAVDADGRNLERITHSPGFDGFPMFSPDGRYLLFSSNRATPPGRHDTNLFLARWDADAQVALQPTAAERIAADATWLADPAREGRGVGTRGLEQAGAFIEQRMQALGLEPLGDAGGYRQPFEVTTAVHSGSGTRLSIAGKDLPADAFVPAGFSGQGSVRAKVVLAGYGISDPQRGIDDYAGLDVRGKIALVRRFAPEHAQLASAEAQRKAGDLRRKAFEAKAHGAVGLIVVDLPPSAAGTQLPDEAPLLLLQPEGPGDAGIPVLIAKRAPFAPVFAALEHARPVEIALAVSLELERTPAFNVLGRIAAGQPQGQGALIIGAHYDHLGYGGRDSLAPDQHVPHLGADDNASGSATVLEIARRLHEQRAQLTRDVIIAAFSGEELGVLGSAALVASKPAWLEHTQAMFNLDMVGRLRNNTLEVLGSDTARQWPALIAQACEAARVNCKASGDGYGPSDHMTFYSAGLPVLHFFTGSHADYHKPSDAPNLLNDIGMARVAEIVTNLALASEHVTLDYQKVAQAPGRGDARSWNASLGTIPDYGGPPQGIAGVLLADVRKGGAAELAGMRRGDILIKLGKFDVRSVQDLMFVLMQAKPGQTVDAVVLRDGRPLTLHPTFQEGRRH